MYTIKKLADIAGISTRTLRYYDEIDLLNPTSYTTSNYRLYDQGAVNRLQHILLYKKMGIPLETIISILDHEAFDAKKALEEHRKALMKEKEQIDVMIDTIDKTLKYVKGDLEMTDKEKFEGLRDQMIEAHEIAYGDEARALYGDQVTATIGKMKGMSKDEMHELEILTEDMHQLFVEAFEAGDPTSKEAMKACEMHKKWLSYYWDFYSAEAHLGLVTLYVEDQRFTDYYDNMKKGLATFMLQAMKHHLAK